jgi:hypothetical protein
LSGYANSFTQDYMQSREVHFVAVVDARSISQVARVLNLAKKHKLALGHVMTTSSAVYSDQVIANDGDTIVEIVGTIAIAGHYDLFLAEVRREVSISQLTAEGVTVSVDLIVDC